MPEVLHEAGHILAHGFLDTLKLLPFLFLTYLLMELLENKAGERVEKIVQKSGRVGPLLGAALGLLPQCGFSAAAAGFYAGGVVTVGTLLAVFLSTSDEMLAIFLGRGLSPRIILTVLGVKFITAALVGFLADLLSCRRRGTVGVTELCREEGCHCEQGVLRSALHHTWRIGLFVLLINLALEALFALVPMEALVAFLQQVPLLGILAAALIGLVPSCAASVAIATLYAEGVLSIGALLAGLLPGAGAGLLVLLRTHRNRRSCLLLMAVLLAVGVTVGILAELLGLDALLQL
ncbi:MAG: arsenic efflux protein [Clostridia bacterium]|nr:arsenic efflux protein [Clostridia bacterium]